VGVLRNDSPRVWNCWLIPRIYPLAVSSKDDTVCACTAEPLQGHVQALNDIICDLVIYVTGGEGGGDSRETSA